MSDTTTPKKTRLLYWIQILTAVVGVVISLYLLIQHTRLKNGIQGTDSFCSFGPYADCDTVNASIFSEVLGIPTASLGALFYFVLFILGIVAPPRDKHFKIIQRFFGYAALVGLGIDFLLLMAQTFYIRSLCVLCLSTYAVTAIHLFLTYSLNGRNWKSVFQKELPIPGLRWTSAQKGLVVIGIVLFSASLYFIPNYVKLQGQSYQQADASVEQFFSQFKTMPRKKVNVKPTDLTMGNAAAPIQLIEYSDFQCPHCKHASKMLHTLMNQWGSKVHFIFRNYPLDSSCNSSLVYPMHAQACKLARLAYCANSKTKFWDFHDYVFNEEWNSPFQADRVAKFFTPQEYELCLNDEHSLRLVQQDIDEGNQIDIKGTPAIFINGKAVSIPLTLENITRLIKIEETLN